MSTAEARRLPIRLNANDNASSGVTLDVLASYSGVSARTVKQWNQDGLLPSPVRVSDGRGRGRAPYRFPPSAVLVAQRLATFRRFVASSEDAKIWLSLEGLNNMGVSDDEIEGRLRNWHAALWYRAGTELTSLSRIEHAALDEELRDEILDDIDRTVRQPLQSRHPTLLAEAGTSIFALMLGVADPVDVAEWIDLAQSDSSEGQQLVGFIEATIELLGQISALPTRHHLTLSDAEERYLTAHLAAFLPRLRRLPESLDWARLRVTWTAICQATDPILADPDTAPDPWTALACQWRRLCYRNPPELTLMVLAAIACDPSWGVPQATPSGSSLQANSAMSEQSGVASANYLQLAQVK